MTEIRILFLGASRLVSLMERFKAAAAAEDIAIELYSVDDDSAWHAVAASGLCKVFAGPSFFGPEFGPFLQDVVRAQRIDVVIPSMDTATVALAKFHPALSALGADGLVSARDLCESMRDKRKAEVVFRDWGVSIPDGTAWPRVAKPRFGSSARGHVIFRDDEELQFWSARNPLNDYIVQPYLSGREYSVDAYVDRGGRVLGAVARVRIVVSGGEVMVARTDRNPAVLEIAEKVLAQHGWRGPINIQVMDTPSRAFLLEVNPRFSSGHTCAIEAGLDSPRWIIREVLGRSLPEKPVAWQSGLCMTRCKKDYFLWLS